MSGPCRPSSATPTSRGGVQQTRARRLREGRNGCSRSAAGLLPPTPPASRAAGSSGLLPPRGPRCGLRPVPRTPSPTTCSCSTSKLLPDARAGGGAAAARAAEPPSRRAAVAPPSEPPPCRRRAAASRRAAEPLSRRARSRHDLADHEISQRPCVRCLPPVSLTTFGRTSMRACVCVLNNTSVYWNAIRYGWDTNRLNTKAYAASWVSLPSAPLSI